MKQIIALLVLSILLLSFASCTQDQPEKPENSDTTATETESSTEPQSTSAESAEDTTVAESDAAKEAVILPELMGYWNSTAVTESGMADNTFICFAENEDGQVMCGDGLWATEYCEMGTVSDIAYDADDTLTFKVHVDAVEGTEMYPGKDAYDYDAIVRLADLSNGKISVDFGHVKGDFIYVGTDMDAGYQAWSDALD